MWPFRKPAEPAPEPKPERIDPTVPPRGFFSTDMGWLPSNVADWNRQNAFQRTAADFVASDSGMAMDSIDGLKSQFTLGQQGANSLLMSWYISQGFIGYQSCALIAQHWLVDKACSQGARDAIRNGYEITVNDGEEVGPEVLDYIRDADKRFGLNRNMEEFAKFNRVFGIRIALFQVDSTDPEYYEKPFNPDGVTPGSYKGIAQIDPYWITPELDMRAVANPESRHFYEPTWWRVSGKRYHRTHLIVIRGAEVADILKPSYLYGGVSLVQQIYERVYAAERTANEAPQLAETKRLNVLKVDTAAALGNQEEFEGNLNRWVYYRNNYGIKVIGGDEEVTQFDTSLADLDNVIMTQYQLVAAVARVPATKLLGTTPKGFNATGEAEESSYHEELESIQTHELQPLLERHHLLLMRSEVLPKFGICPSITVKWNPTDAATALELAQTNLAKAQADLALQQSGAIDGIDIRNRLINDPDSGYNGLAADAEIESDPVEDPLGLTDGQPSPTA